MKTTRAVSAPVYEGPVGDVVDDDGVEWPSGYVPIPSARVARVVMRPCVAKPTSSGFAAPVLNSAAPAPTSAAPALTSAALAPTSAVPELTSAVPALTSAVPALTSAVKKVTWADRVHLPAHRRVSVGQVSDPPAVPGEVDPALGLDPSAALRI